MIFIERKCNFGNETKITE